MLKSGPAGKMAQTKSSIRSWLILIIQGVVSNYLIFWLWLQKHGERLLTIHNSNKKSIIVKLHCWKAARKMTHPEWELRGVASAGRLKCGCRSLERRPHLLGDYLSCALVLRQWKAPTEKQHNLSLVGPNCYQIRLYRGDISVAELQRLEGGLDQMGEWISVGDWERGAWMDGRGGLGWILVSWWLAANARSCLSSGTIAHRAQVIETKKSTLKTQWTKNIDF